VKRLIYLLPALILGATACLAQSTNLESAISAWGKPVRGVQMSISVTNNFIPMGSNFMVTIEIKNESTNILHIGKEIDDNGFAFFVTDESGMVYELDYPDAFAFFDFNDGYQTYSDDQAYAARLEPGQRCALPMDVSFQELDTYGPYHEPHVYVPPGKYILTVIGAFRTGSGTIDPQSNLKIQIK
jgi:hypothetical protein